MTNLYQAKNRGLKKPPYFTIMNSKIIMYNARIQPPEFEKQGFSSAPEKQSNSLTPIHIQWL